MRIRCFLALALAAGCAVDPHEGALGGQGPAGAQPNVVFILTDDQRWDQLSSAGHPFLETPHLDQLAAEGARFANMFVTTSLCSPSRASFLSGLYANTHGVVNNFTDYPHSLASFPRRLHDSGYHTGYVGKWHMGEDDDTRRPGFDYWVSHRGQGTYYDNEWNLNGERGVVSGYYTDVVTDLAIEFLQSDHGGRPFMLILGHKAPHTPFTPEARYADLYDDVPIGYPASASQLEGKPEWVEQRLDTWHGIYGPIYGFRETFPDRSDAAAEDFDAFVRSYTASIKSIDDSVGRIRSALDSLGVLENTLIVFAGDNGMFLGEYGMTDKRAMHEPSIRVPLIVRYPGLVRPGTVVEQQVLNIDLAPSIIEICGAEPLGDIHGESWVRLLRGDVEGWRTSWYYEYNYEKQFPFTPNVRGVRTDRWKFSRSPHSSADARAPIDRHRAELYDLESDPDERFNLIDEPSHAETVRSLRAELDRLVDAHGGRSYQRMPVDEGILAVLPDARIR